MHRAPPENQNPAPLAEGGYRVIEKDRLAARSMEGEISEAFRIVQPQRPVFFGAASSTPLPSSVTLSITASAVETPPTTCLKRL